MRSLQAAVSGLWRWDGGQSPLWGHLAPASAGVCEAVSTGEAPAAQRCVESAGHRCSTRLCSHTHTHTHTCCDRKREFRASGSLSSFFFILSSARLSLLCTFPTIDRVTGVDAGCSLTSAALVAGQKQCIPASTQLRTSHFFFLASTPPPSPSHAHMHTHPAGQQCSHPGRLPPTSTRGPGFMGLEPVSRGIQARAGVPAAPAEPEAPNQAEDRPPDLRSLGGSLTVKTWASLGRFSGEHIPGSRGGDEAELGCGTQERCPALPDCWSLHCHLSLCCDGWRGQRVTLEHKELGGVGKGYG